jgi:hypothetical protein
MIDEKDKEVIEEKNYDIRSGEYKGGILEKPYDNKNGSNMMELYKKNRLKVSTIELGPRSDPKTYFIITKMTTKLNAEGKYDVIEKDVWLTIQEFKDLMESAKYILGGGIPSNMM